jgi:predicted NodU family carbamoyl transferase
VALNCVGNGRILREGPFEQIWIQPAAGDAGGALGVAHEHLASPSRQRPPERRVRWARGSGLRRRQMADCRMQTECRNTPTA